MPGASRSIPAILDPARKGNSFLRATSTPR